MEYNKTLLFYSNIGKHRIEICVVKFIDPFKISKAFPGMQPSSQLQHKHITRPLSTIAVDPIYCLS